MRALLVESLSPDLSGVTLAELQNMSWNPKDGGSFEQLVKKLTVDSKGNNATSPAPMTPPTLFVGVDMAQKTFVWAIHGQPGTHCVSNDDSGFEQLLKALQGQIVDLLVLEATGGLERALATYLLQHGLAVAVVNPRAAREFARSMGHLAKTDAIDALALAHYAQTLAARADQSGMRYAPASEQVQQLQALVMRRAQLLNMRTAEKNRLGGSIRVLRQSMRALTGWLVERQTEFGSLDRYFDGYCIAGDRLAGLQVPTRILMAADDPVIPVADFHRLQLPAHARLEISPWGGHCGFVEDGRLEGFAERWIASQLAAGDTDAG